MTTAQTMQVKIQLEVDGLRYEAVGSPEEIIPQIMRILSQAIPTYDLAKKLVYVPDLAGLADRISEFAKMTNAGQLLLTRTDLPAEKAILIVLFMAQLAARISKRPSESLSIEEIANAVGKAAKTIRNVIVELLKSGLLERADRGNYRATARGLMELERFLSTDSQKGGKP